MIRPLTIATFLMACGSGLYLYQSKHEAQVLDRTIEKTVRETAAFREQSRLLSAEWTMLNDPDALRRFSDTYLALKPIAPPQFTSLADLDSRLPPVQLPALPPSQGMDDDAPAPIANALPATSLRTTASAIVVPSQPLANQSVAAQSVTGQPTTPTLAADEAQPAIHRPASASVHQAERKVATSRPAAADPAPYVRTATLDSHPSEQRVAEPKAAEQRGVEARSYESQAAESRVARSAEARVAGARAMDMRPAPAASPPRPAVLASAPRPVGEVASIAPAHVSAPPPAPFTGSFLGVAHGSAPPVPRPTPVTATQWSNAN